MKPWLKGVIIAAVQVALVGSLGAKLLYDRSTLPRGWARAVPYDPDLPIRGRYVSLTVAVQPEGVEANSASGWPVVTLRVVNGLLQAVPGPAESRYQSFQHRLNFVKRQDATLAVLDKPVPFFIPEHVADPSRRAPGEELWVEVTVPKKGPLRPIRLGVSKDNGPIVPLNLS